MQVAEPLVVAEPVRHERPQLLGSRALGQDDPSDRHRAVAETRTVDDRGVSDRRVLAQHELDVGVRRDRLGGRSCIVVDLRAQGFLLRAIALRGKTPGPRLVFHANG
jgi:hypothetical protein